MSDTSQAVFEILNRIVDYDHLWDYTHDLYQLPGIAGHRRHEGRLLRYGETRWLDPQGPAA
jgi:hypothetical protein